MSKYVKDLVSRDIQNRLGGVADAVLVSYVGMDANTTNELRGDLSAKGIEMMLVKNSLARRATAGTSLFPAFEGASGPLAVCWSGGDFISLVKEIVSLDKDKGKFSKFKAEGGVLDGEALSAEKLVEVSKWPTREEQIGMLVGQLLGPGSQLSAAMIGPGGKLASQIEEKSKGSEEAA
ncbi:50S ribosomal protein L10 [Planctomycetaceae bacterium SH139]